MQMRVLRRARSFGGFSRILNSTRDQLAGEPLTIAKSDYDAFERVRKHPSCLLRRGTFSSARYGHSRLSYFSAEFGGHASRGLINRVTDVKLLQGDLAEAWREGPSDYATVAMKFALRDSIVERASGRLVEGGELSEVTELFVRVRGGNWPLSAIQQT